MKWGRRTEYHGTRTYGSDEVVMGQFTLLWSWLGFIAKRRFQDLRRLAMRSSPSAHLLADGEPHFSVLGESSGTPANKRAADCPFPTSPISERNPCDWRVLP